MAKLEDLTRGASVKGILPDCLVTVIDVKWYGSAAIELTYKDPAGKPSVVLLYRNREPTLEIGEAGRPWSFDGDGKLFRLVSEAHRINLAHLFDPLLAIHTSMVDPLPHQITAVYGEMLPRQPLRFLLADDPGAGKTIMAGLLIKELLIRGDLHRCMIVCPGNLAEQWQDELYQRFQLPFEILTNDKLESARTGNWFAENPLAICRLDKLSRNEDVQAKLANTDWDLVVCDEAHKMSATFFGSEVKYTKRYRLGQLLGQLTRHLLMMTATPHNGKPEDFQLFLALLDSDRFEGRSRDGVHTVDASDLMRRLVKEQLLKFDGTPLFPERRAYTVGYKLSDAEAALYKSVTDYVREEFNRADALENEGRKGTVGFALTILQRRLASSPEAILQSLRRRRERLERRLREEQTFLRECSLGNGTRIDEVFEFDIRPVPIQEILNVDLSVMVSAEVVSAYSQLKVPCIVEHAGLIFSEYADRSYPGGLTKPMWDTLKDGFVKETGSAGRSAVARAVIAYCDGKQVKTFVGERAGKIADRPRGSREFYWDTVFIPEDNSGRSQDLTYAEIVESTDLGLAYKMRELSQSSAAMKSFLEYRLKTGDPELWR